MNESLKKMANALSRFEQDQKLKLALKQKVAIERANLIVNTEFSVKTCSLMLEKYGLALAEEAPRTAFTSVTISAKPDPFEDIKYEKSDSIGLKDLISWLTPP